MRVFSKEIGKNRQGCSEGGAKFISFDTVHLPIYACHSYCRGHANLIRIVPICTDVDFRHAEPCWDGIGVPDDALCESDEKCCDETYLCVKRNTRLPAACGKSLCLGV